MCAEFLAGASLETGNQDALLSALARLVLGTVKSRGYCLEMIAADFLAGASLEAGAENTLFLALARLIGALPVAQRLQLLEIVSNGLEPVHTEAAATEA